MVELQTDTEIRVLTPEEPYLIYRIHKRYFLMAEQLSDTSVVLCVFDAKECRDLLPHQSFPAQNAVAVWQFCREVLRLL